MSSSYDGASWTGTRFEAKWVAPEHHRKIERLLSQLCEQARIDDPDGLRIFWNRFESELERHLSEEDKHVLPAFAVDYPDEARALAAEHWAIRSELEELGASVDLHAFSAKIADALAARLRDHAAREDRLFHPWLAAQWKRR